MCVCISVSQRMFSAIFAAYYTATTDNLPRLFLVAKEIIKLINDALFLSCSTSKHRQTNFS